MDIDIHCKRIDGRTMKIGLDFTNKIGGIGKGSENIYAARNSLIYRLGSIRFHLTNYVNFRIDIEDQLEKLGGFSISPIESGQISSHYSYMFDDLIFNLVSFLDYLGNLIDQTVNEGRIKDWPGLAKAAKPKSSNKFNKLQVAQDIIKFDKEIAQKLYEYRSELIHEKAHEVGHTLTLKSRGFDEVKPFTPRGFVTKFHELRKLKKEGNGILLDNTIVWLTTNFFEETYSVMTAAIADIDAGRKIAKEDEPFKFRR